MEQGGITTKNRLLSVDLIFSSWVDNKGMMSWRSRVVEIQSSLISVQFILKLKAKEIVDEQK